MFSIGDFARHGRFAFEQVPLLVHAGPECVTEVTELQQPVARG